MTATRRKAEPVEASETWWCLTCEELGKPREERPRAGMSDHLKADHGLAEPLSGMKSTIAHMDYARYYAHTYAWTFGEVRALQGLIGPRGRR